MRYHYHLEELAHDQPTALHGCFRTREDAESRTRQIRQEREAQGWTAAGDIRWAGLELVSAHAATVLRVAPIDSAYTGCSARRDLAPDPVGHAPEEDA